MPLTEIRLHKELLNELLDNVCHSSAQVREAIGVTLSVLCSNIRRYMSSVQYHSHEREITDIDSQLKEENWMASADADTPNGYQNGDSQDDVKWMETLFHFIISTLKSGRSSYLLDVIVGLLYPVISLQETSNKDLSTLAKAAFEFAKMEGFMGTPSPEGCFCYSFICK
ncbi:hypothetical protein SLA2020_228220 [Shorea laevis]